MGQGSIEIVLRLGIARKTSFEAFKSIFFVHDLVPGADLATHWPAITLAYSGLEQTFKYLVSIEQNKSIQETRGYISKKIGGNQGHNIYEIFLLLNSGTRCELREHYAQFQSLHSYINAPKLDGFLKEISIGDKDSEIKGRGYERWRYLLIEPGNDLPRNSALAMFYVWRIAVEIAEFRKHGGSNKPTPIKKLIWQFFSGLLSFIRGEFALKVQNARKEWQDDRPEYNRWICDRHHCSEINALAWLLQHHEQRHRDIWDGMSDNMKMVMEWWIKKIDDKFRKGELPPDMWMFVARATGHTKTGMSIRWEYKSERFVDVP